MVPAQDYDSNRLISGELQVSNGTMLLVDQTTLREGKIHGTAVANLRALQDLVTQQTIPVDFKFYNTTLPVDVPVISVCTTNSMLKDFCTVPLRSQRQQVSLEQLSASQIQNIRNYLESVRWRNDLGVVANDISSVLEQGLSEARKRGIKLEQSDAHRWLTTATLLAKSHGIKFYRNSFGEVDSDGYGSTFSILILSLLLLVLLSFSCCIFFSTVYIHSFEYIYTRVKIIHTHK